MRALGSISARISLFSGSAGAALRPYLGRVGLITRNPSSAGSSNSGANQERLRPEEAAARYSALLSPELYHLLTVECGWSPERYESWVADSLDRDLLA